MTYQAYPYGKMNQSFQMIDEAGRSVYEANLIKFHLFGASDFEFVNKKTMHTEPHQVGKTVSSQVGGGGLSATTTSYFKIDKKNVFDILDEKGCNLKLIAKVDILHPEFALVSRNQEQIAVYKMNVLADRQEGVRAIGNKQRNTLITTDCDDLDLVFLGAFLLHRVDFSAYLM